MAPTLGVNAPTPRLNVFSHEWERKWDQLQSSQIRCRLRTVRADTKTGKHRGELIPT